MALAAGADGVHLGQADGDPAKARALLGRDAIVGLSVTAEAEIAGVDAGVVDYVGLGPVFATPTKADAAPALGLDGIRCDRPAAAGAVRRDRRHRPRQCGRRSSPRAPSASPCVSAICAVDDPRAAAAALRDAIARGIAR